MWNKELFGLVVSAISAHGQAALLLRAEDVLRQIVETESYGTGD